MPEVPLQVNPLIEPQQDEFKVEEEPQKKFRSEMKAA
jgi:hypothetical protein